MRVGWRRAFKRGRTSVALSWGRAPALHFSAGAWNCKSRGWPGNLPVLQALEGPERPATDRLPLDESWAFDDRML